MAKKLTTGRVVPVQKAWLSKAEACAYLDCDERFLAKLRNEAKITSTTIGAKFFYELASIEYLLNLNKVAAVRR